MLTRGLSYLRQFRSDERGQSAWAVVLLMVVVFMFFAVAFDVGMWMFDHRTAQNQAEAAALAAVQELPSDDTTAAEAAAQDYLARNHVDWASEGCPSGWIEFDDDNEDGDYDKVRVCLERETGVVFSGLSNVGAVDVSAAATALVGRANIAQVMPLTFMIFLVIC